MSQNASHLAIARPVVPAPARAALLACFALASFAMLPAQIFRLFQTEALPWLLADYAGRLCALLVVTLLPAGRRVLSRAANSGIGWGEAICWIFGILALFHLTGLNILLAGFFPETRLGHYPSPGGALYLFDLTCGLALVALHEEIVFRKLAAAALELFLRNEWMLVLVSAVIFAVYHWWTGLGNMLGALIYGLVAMACYRRAGSLWPIGIAHYLLDVVAFA